MTWARVGFRLVGGVLGGSLVLQFYFAGLAAFGAASFDAHALTGYAIVLLALVWTFLAALAGAGRRTVGLVALLIPLTILQPVLAFAPRVDAPAVSALHTVNALVIVFLVAGLVRGR